MMKPYTHRRLVLKIVHRVSKLNQNASLKSYIDMNTDLGKKVKSGFEKNFFWLINNAVFWEAMDNLRKYIKLVTTKRRNNYLVSKPNFHSSKFLTKNLLAIEMKKTEILINKPVCFRLSILELNKILMYEFCYFYVKPKYDEKPRLRYMDTNSFFVYIKTDDIYKDMPEDVKTRFDTSNCELEFNFFGWSLSKRQN